MNGPDLLRRFLDSFDPHAFALSAANPDSIAAVRADLPADLTITDEALTGILGYGATEGVTRLLEAACLHIDVHGLGPDESADALIAVMAEVAAAHHSLTRARYADTHPIDRAYAVHEAHDRLTALLTLWAEACKDPDEPTTG